MFEKFRDKLTGILPPQTQLLVLSSLVLISLLAMLGFAIILNRQLVVQRQSSLARSEYMSVRNIAQLQREHLRLSTLVQAGSANFAQDAFTLQRNLVNSRLKVLQNAYNGISQRPEGQQQLFLYEQKWQALQQPLDAWAANPQDSAERSQLLSQFHDMELLINDMMNTTQNAFEERILEWINSSHALSNLVLIASIVFIILAILTAYSIFHFFAAQRRSEDALRASEYRHRAILETIPDAVFRIRSNGVFNDFKPAQHLAAYLPGAECIGKGVAEVLSDDVAQLYMQAIAQALQLGEAQIVDYELQDGGSAHNFEARVIPSGKNEVQVIVRDITDEKIAEQRLQQAQKLESLGVLAGGIAHDFNNLLTGMLGQASLAKLKISKGLGIQEHIDKVIVSAERAADLTRQLLAYAGKGKFQIVHLELNQLLSENAALLETALPGRVELQLDLAPTLPTIEADRGQIQQVVMNLVINAAEALHETGGYVRITTRSEVMLTASDLTAYMGSDLQPGHYVMLRVSDNGIGMEPRTLSRIFDPFFSTKVNGHGLGLSATLGIIRTHRGGIHVQSQPDVGTTFTLLFPVAQQNLTVAPKPASTTLSPATNEQVVLIIDDEALVRDAIVDILQMDGFTVIAASGGEEGLAQFRQYQAQIGVVVLDMKMPGMSGEETFQRLRQLDAAIKIILSSGYNESQISRDWHTQGITAFLQKPYDFTVFTETIRKALLTTT